MVQIANIRDDGLQRLVDMQRGLLNGGHTAVTNQTYGQEWNLDPTENWKGMNQAVGGSSWTLEQSRTANPVNEITGISETTGPSWITPTYDPAGNTTTIPQPNDPTKSFTGTWDAWNRLVKLVDAATSNTIAEYQYDGQNRRIVKQIYASGSLNETRHLYLSPRWQTLEVRIDSSTDPERQFVWGERYIDDLILRDRDTTSGGTLNERLYACQDANWNIVALADTSGTVQERFAYDPYGRSLVLAANFTPTTDSYAWEYRFTGRELDLESALDYFRHRYYHSGLGCFLSRDPIRYVDGGSMYAGYFVGGCVDPSGCRVVTHATSGICGGGSAYVAGVLCFCRGGGPPPLGFHVASRRCGLDCCNSPLSCWGRSGILAGNCVAGCLIDYGLSWGCYCI